jgi:hypothetical protein
MVGIASIGIVEPYYAWLPSTADINNLAPVKKMVPNGGHLGYVCKVSHVFTGTIRKRRYVVSRFVPRGVLGCIVTGTAPGTQGLDVTRSRSRYVSAPVPSPGPSQLPLRFRDPWVSECRVRVLRYRTPSRRVGRPRARGPVGFWGARVSPTFRPIFCLSPLEYTELQTQFSAFLKFGILEPSESSYGAPVLFLPKPSGQGLRLCIDYRALNSKTINIHYPIPRIDDLLDAGSKYFTSLDQTSGYYWVLISEEDRPKTAFCTPWGHYQFKVLIETLTNAPTTFQSVMNSIFHPYLRRFVVVYLIDILIYSKSAEEHQAHVHLVLETLRREKFYVCEAKSSFANSERQFLGHVVSAEGIRLDSKKV